MRKPKKLPQRPTNYYKIALLALAAIFILLFAVQAALIKDLYNRVVILSGDKIQSLIIQAARDLENEPVVDFQTGKEYIPENRLALPPSGELNVSYYSDAEGVTFGDRSNINQAINLIQSGYSIDNTFKNVPNLQACSRQVVVQFSQENSEDLVYLQDKQLTDGRVIYLYENTECSGESTKLVEYIKQVDSY